MASKTRRSAPIEQVQGEPSQPDQLSGAGDTMASAESKRMKRLRMVMRKALSTTVDAMLKRDLQKSLDPLQSVVDNETFQQLMTLEQGVAEVFKKHTEKEFEVACAEYKLEGKFQELDQLIERAKRQKEAEARRAAAQKQREQQSQQSAEMDVSPAACELEEDPEAVLRACRVQEKLQERAILEEYLAQELQGLKEREDRLTQTVAQVEGVVDELSGFTERLQEAMRDPLETN